MISIIVPVYNGEKYISNVLDNFQAQVMKDFEVIFVDDGSLDNSYQLINQYQNSGEYSFPIKLYKQENKGVSSARNTGIDNSIGEYICFVDVDDGISKDYLFHMYNLISETKSSMVFCKTTSREAEEILTEEIINVFSGEEALVRYLYHELTSGACSLMVKSQIIKQNNLRFKVGYNYSEDLHMVWRMIHYSEKIVETNKSLYIYRVNEGSAMSKFGPDRLDSILLMEDLEVFFKKNNKSFYQLFKKYGKARIEWSLLWQAAYNLDLYSFLQFTKQYDFKEGLKLLFDYKQKYVRYSAFLFRKSKTGFYILAKFASRRFRKTEK